MGKASRIKAQRRSRSRRRITVVNGLEIGHKDGMVTLRAGRQEPGEVPVRFAMPASMFEPFVPGLLTAADDAEEDYWRIIGPLLRQLPEPSDPVAVAAHKEAWLLEQDWEWALGTVPVEDGASFALTHAGHVGMAVNPPFTTERMLFVFDPIQLRRVTPSLTSAIAAGQQTPPTAPWSLTQSLAAVHSFLATRPWPMPGHTGPTVEQAESQMRRHYAEFLGRPPNVRPADGNLNPDASGGDEQRDVETPTETATGCERCDFSRAEGGIVCVCGHDWACHDGVPGSGEPCTHCSCTDMLDPVA